MRANIVSLLAVLTALLLFSAPILANSQETRTLDAEADGLATDRASSTVLDASLELSGDVTVSTSDFGVDRTAYTAGPAVTLILTIDEIEYTIPLTLAGDGVSLVQIGAEPDAWRLSAQGSTIGQGGQFRGAFNLVGTDEGYALTGDGVFTLTDGASTASYALDYSGSATFE